MPIAGARVARPEWWAAASIVALLAASRWLAVVESPSAPSVQYLALAAAATVASLALLIGDRAERRVWRLGSSLLLGVVVAVMIPAEARLHTIDTKWDEWKRTTESEGLRRLSGALTQAIDRAGAAADSALTAPTTSREAFDRLDRLTRTSYESGVVLQEGDSTVAWSGQIRFAIDSAEPGVAYLTSAFYRAAQVTRVAGNRRAIAMALIDAAPPADRIAASLSGEIARGSMLPGFQFTDRPGAHMAPGTLRFPYAGNPMFDIRVRPPDQQTTRFAIVEQARVIAGLALAGALVGFVIALWRLRRRLTQRFAALAVALACTAIVPLNQYSNISRLFDPGVYRVAVGDRVALTAGALAFTSAILLAGALLVVRRQRHGVGRLTGGIIVVLVAGVSPFLLRDLARGIAVPVAGIDSALWLIWEVPLFLAAVFVLLVGAIAGDATLGRARRLSPWLAPGLAGLGAVLAPIVWRAPGSWPWWYVFLWILAIVALALSRSSRFVVLTAATVAALAAITLVWGHTSRDRVELAEADLRSLNTVDPFVDKLLTRFATDIASRKPPASTQALLQAYVGSDLASGGYPVKMYAWGLSNLPNDSLQTVAFDVPPEAVREAIREARSTHATVLTTASAWPGREAILVVPATDSATFAQDSAVTVVVVAPKSRLYAQSPFARLYGIETADPVAAPYSLGVKLARPVALPDTQFGWTRRGSELHGDWVESTSIGLRAAHAEVDLREMSTLIQRGGLIVILNLAIVGALWFAGVLADGSAGRWLRARRRVWVRSYRARLTLAMFTFFVIPATAFAIWSYQQLGSEATSIRTVLVSQTLRSANPRGAPETWVPEESNRLRTPLLLYSDGMIQMASDPVIAALAPLGRLLPRQVFELMAKEEGIANRRDRVADRPVLVGFRPVQIASGTTRPAILAAPLGTEEYQFEARRRDLVLLVLFTTAVGLLAAFWLSGVAANQLARPIGSLRQAALAIAGGDRLPILEPHPTTEFRPVFTAFRRMAEDLNAGRTALEDAQRRTAAVLRNVASGVIAVAPDRTIALANPSAEALFGTPLPAGASIAGRLPHDVVDRIVEFLMGDADEVAFELDDTGRQIRGHVTRLGRGGAVLTMDDVTAIGRAQRVLAWGEMARQVAHEIKNPLTPIRLGVQHLRRARADRRVDFDTVLDQNITRILIEIDRLDEIARSFSRYGSAPHDRPAPEPTDVAAVSRDVLELERLGAELTTSWAIRGADDPVFAMARPDELREVLLNILENARLADARAVSLSVVPGGERVQLAVQDDGRGIPAAVLPRIFEPHFSTRTSGSGLGLAISRQIVDRWGGDIQVESTEGVGTTVTITLRSAAAPS
jgi:two-component system nitrogen regulation sensor histidine kinase NtrY